MRVCTEASELGSAEVCIPGWAAHPDLVPASPSAYDDEFGGPLSGDWTAYHGSTLVAYDAGSTHPSHLYIEAVPGTTSDSQGVYRSCPSTPFTVTAKLADGLSSINVLDNFSDTGLFVGDGTPGRMLQLSLYSNQDDSTYNVEVQLWHDFSTYVDSPLWGPNTNGYSRLGAPAYLRWVVASSTDFSAYTSWSGLLWTPRLLHYNPTALGQTFSGVNCVGLATNRGIGNLSVRGVYDWIRFS